MPLVSFWITPVYGVSSANRLRLHHEPHTPGLTLRQSVKALIAAACHLHGPEPVGQLLQIVPGQVGQLLNPVLVELRKAIGELFVPFAALETA